jgi:hypothetical protein
VEVNQSSKIFAGSQPLSTLERIIAHAIYQRTVDRLSRCIQTEEDEGYSLHQRLQKIDEKFIEASNSLKEKQAGRANGQGIKDIERIVRQEYESMLKKEMLVFKETEMRNYRIKIDLEAEEKYKRRDLEREQAYLAKISGLKEREGQLYSTMESKLDELERKEVGLRRGQLMKLTELEDQEKRIGAERKNRMLDLEDKQRRLDEKEQQLLMKVRDVEDLKHELEFNLKQLEKRNNVKPTVNG